MSRNHRCRGRAFLARSLGAAVLALAPAGAQQTRVIPAQTEAGGGLTLSQPFSNGVGRFQQLFLGSEFGRAVATLRSLSFRADGLAAIRYAPRSSFTKVTFGSSQRSVATMSRNFASNRSGAQTTIFSGYLSLPAQAPRTGKAGPWNITIKPAAPYLYVPRNGELLLELSFTQPQQVPSFYGLDAVRYGALGNSRSFGQSGAFRSGERHTITGRNTRLLPGGALEFYAFGLRKAYPAIALFGFSDQRFGTLPLPLDLRVLGALGQWLLVSPDVLVPFPLQPRGSTFLGAVSSPPLPVLRALDGARLFAQALYIDAASNAAGLVTSNGIRFELGRARSSATTISLWSLSANSTTGTLALGTTPAGLVVRFEGSFR